VAVKFTLDELIVCRAAREIRDREIVVIGQGLPMAAGILARKTHAPNALIVTEAGIVGMDPFKIPLHIADTSCCQGYAYGCDMFDVFTSILNLGYVDVAFLGVGQVDRHGNVNSSYVTAADGSRRRLTGAGGAPEFGGYAKRTVLTMRGGEFKETLDYLTTPGYLDGGDSRYRAGMPAGSGPTVLITGKAVFRFDPVTKEMVLASLHPGRSFEEVASEIPWEIRVARPLETTAPPTQKEIDIIRRLAPDISMGRSLYAEVLAARVLSILAKSERKT